MPQVVAALASLFGYHAFRPHQEDIVRATLAGRDSFTVMPTGGGKSLCYQLPAHLLPGVCVVVSPLISLMKDQVDSARANGIRAATLNSSTPAASRGSRGGYEERAGQWPQDGEWGQAETYSALRAGTLDLLYVSPERLRIPAFLEYLKSLRISFFAIDEAHCISEWGHDFRPDYLALSELASHFPGVPIAAFTATATPRVADDIARRLALRDPHRTLASFNRPNLFYQVSAKGDLEKQLLAFLRERESEPGIIYRTTRKNVDATTALLKRHGIDARAYHAGLPDLERAAAQDAFRMDDCRVIVATVAFGMGIDKSNVRFVVHADLPKNLEGYYQETGRAGRDGAPARCVLFYGRSDSAQLLHFARAIEDPVAREVAQKQLYRMMDFTRTDSCRRRALLRYFGEELPGGNCGGCDICLGEVEREDATVPAQKALSAMARTGGVFGLTHIVGILTGSRRAQILQRNHHLLPTYGVGKDRDRIYWRNVIEALVGQGMALVAGAEFPGLAVSETGWQVLRGQRPFHMLRQAETAASRARKRVNFVRPGPGVAAGSVGSAADAAGTGADNVAVCEGLFEALRRERTRLAVAANVPPYVVFSDRTLQEMAAFFPDSPELLLAINGVGRHKLAVYGQDMLRVIADYLSAASPDATTDAPEEMVASARELLRARVSVSAPGSVGEGSEYSAPPIPRDASAPILSETVRETARHLAAGLGIQAIAAERGLKTATIMSHLEALVEAGEVVNAGQLPAPERLEQYRAAFAESGGWMLRPALEALRRQEQTAGAGPAAAAEDAAADETGSVTGFSGAAYEEARLARFLLQRAARGH